jgi:hypothetical protein
MRKGSGQDYHQISIRFSPEMSRAIQDQAEKSGRSFSKEVVQLVKAQLAQETKKEPDVTALSERQKW